MKPAIMYIAISVLPDDVLIRPTMYGDTNPASFPTELSIAIPVAAVVPARRAAGNAQNRITAIMAPAAATDSQKMVVAGVEPNIMLALRPNAPTTMATKK